jgi:hypothetical protein
MSRPGRVHPLLQLLWENWEDEVEVARVNSIWVVCGWQSGDRRQVRARLFENWLDSESTGEGEGGGGGSTYLNVAATVGQTPHPIESRAVFYDTSRHRNIRRLTVKNRSCASLRVTTWGRMGGTPDIVHLGIRWAGLRVWRSGRFTSTAHYKGGGVRPTARLDAV